MDTNVFVEYTSTTSIIYYMHMSFVITYLKDIDINSCIITYLKDIDINFSSLKRFVGIKFQDFVSIIILILDNTKENTMHWEGYDLKNDGTRGLDIEKPTTALAMNNPRENNQQSGSDDNPGGKKASVAIDNPAEQRPSSDTETLPTDFKKEIKDLNHACNKYNSVEKKNYHKLVTPFLDLNRDYCEYLDKDDKKELIAILHTEVDTAGELKDVHGF